MYNRYIPQPDGSFRRNRVEDPRTKNPPPPQGSKQSPSPPPPPPPPPQKEKPHAQHRPSTRGDDCSDGLQGFLRQLFPKDFDTGDLIVILLLLLMAGDCEEDRSHALLTLALYLVI